MNGILRHSVHSLKKVARLPIHDRKSGYENFEEKRMKISRFFQVKKKSSKNDLTRII